MDVWADGSVKDVGYQVPGLIAPDLACASVTHGVGILHAVLNVPSGSQGASGGALHYAVDGLRACWAGRRRIEVKARRSRAEKSARMDRGRCTAGRLRGAPGGPLTVSSAPRPSRTMLARRPSCSRPCGGPLPRGPRALIATSFHCVSSKRRQPCPQGKPV